jgi:hypothetical protein
MEPETKVETSADGTGKPQTANEDGFDLAKYAGLREAKESWPVVLAKELAQRTIHDLAVLAALGALCFVAWRILAAGLDPPWLGLAGSLAVALMISAIGVLALHKAKKTHAKTRKKRGHQAPQPRNERRRPGEPGAPAG